MIMYVIMSSLFLDNPTCVRGFLSRESLNTILEVDAASTDENDFEVRSLHDSII